MCRLLNMRFLQDRISGAGRVVKFVQMCLVSACACVLPNIRSDQAGFCVMIQSVPHVPPAESSDEEPEPEGVLQAAELFQEQQLSEAQLTGHIAQGTVRAQVSLSGA